jgi:ethanolamine utilization protein EutN
MTLARVVGTVVATQKHRTFEGAKLLLVQPLALDDTPRGVALLAVDAVGAGVNEKVLVVIEGRAAAEALGRKGTPVDAAIIGIVDRVDVDERSVPASAGASTRPRRSAPREGGRL